jgi:hypothetical protein
VVEVKECRSSLLKTGLRKRPAYLRQVQEQVLGGLHYRGWPADFTLRFLWKKIPELTQRGMGEIRTAGTGKLGDKVGWAPKSSFWLSFRLTPSPAHSWTTWPSLTFKTQVCTFVPQSFTSLVHHFRVGKSILWAKARYKALYKEWVTKWVTKEWHNPSPWGYNQVNKRWLS